LHHFFFKLGLVLDAMGLVFVAMGTTLSPSNTSFRPGFELFFLVIFFSPFYSKSGSILVLVFLHLLLSFFKKLL